MGSPVWQFQEKYVFKIVDRFEEAVYLDLVNRILGGQPPIEHLLSDEELQRLESLKARYKSPFSLRIGVFLNDELIGLTYGYQSGDGVLEMAISLVHPDHRRTGIYSELLRAVVSISEEEGFQIIRSHHRATNNPILIAKLKAGFIVDGFELSDAMGGLIRLSYYHNPKRRELMDARTGLTRPTGQIRELFF